ncbi:MAG: DUF167 domain-containing protein [Polyangiaceae bacterium]
MSAEDVSLAVTRDGSVRVEVRARPRARTSSVAGARQGALLVDLAAAPVDGAANAELVDALAAVLSVPKRDVVLVRGDSSRNKVVEVRGLGVDEVRARLRVAMR